MSLSDRSLSMLKPSTVMTLTLALASVIPGVIAPKAPKGTTTTTTTTATYSDCYWVVQIWTKLGQSTSVSSTSSTDCCYSLGSKTQTSGIPGVSCTSTGIVTELLWIYKFLSGSIPPEIGNLVNLQYLDLAFNQLSGSIPAEIGKLVNLQKLYLEENQLSGSIPAEIGNLVNLQYLSLRYNQLSGSIPAEIGNLVKLTELGLHYNQLSGSIPAEIGNLANLTWIWLHYNQLSGSIPAEIGNLVNLQKLYLRRNVGLNGTFTPQCSTIVYALDTSVTVCGCSSSASPPSIFPPAGTPDACLASGPSMSLEKRILAFSDVIGSYTFTCSTDAQGNPFADCLNTIAKICNPTSPDFSKTRCKNGVDQMTLNMSPFWQAVRKECGQWPWDGFTGRKDSINCDHANVALQKNAYYTVPDAGAVAVTPALTDSVKVGLWSNTALKG